MREFVREIHQVLRPGGTVHRDDPQRPDSRSPATRGTCANTAEQLRRLLAARFSEIETLRVFSNR